MLFPGATQNGVQPMEVQTQLPKHYTLQHGAGGQSKIPVSGAGKHFHEVNKNTSFSAPSRTNTLPPIAGNSDEKGGTNSRGHSNPEKNKKYAQNPRYIKRVRCILYTYCDTVHKLCRVAPPLQPKHREGSTGVRIKLAEKDQRILESQEYIQVRKLGGCGGVGAERTV